MINLITASDKYYQFAISISNKLIKKNVIGRGTANKLESMFVYFPVNNTLKLSAFIDDFRINRISKNIRRIEARRMDRLTEIAKENRPRCLKNVYMNVVRHSYKETQTFETFKNALCDVLEGYPDVKIENVEYRKCFVAQLNINKAWSLIVAVSYTDTPEEMRANFKKWLKDVNPAVIYPPKEEMKWDNPGREECTYERTSKGLVIQKIYANRIYSPLRDVLHTESSYNAKLCNRCDNYTIRLRMIHHKTRKQKTFYFKEN